LVLGFWGLGFGVWGLVLGFGVWGLEVKGSSVPLGYKHFVVTSNYRIEDIWADQPIMVDAISRRFNVVRKTNHEQYVASVQSLLYGNVHT
jgi:hypothetical protein